jgi:ribA/ribD-fused uncharacterized protein
MYTFFKGGIFSNWTHSLFKIDGIQFVCVEQYMMYKKAIMFNDLEVAAKILKTFNPMSTKMLGRSVKNFDPKIWDQHKIQIVTDACLAKYSQNKDMLRHLIITKGEIVESSLRDKVWGNGLSIDDPNRFDSSKWKGQNLLGKVLTNVRETLRHV